MLTTQILIRLIPLCVGLSIFTDLSAQTGSQDSSLGGQTRPRRETYIIETYPSPARSGQTVNISYYNHIPQETMLQVVDLNDKVVAVLQERKNVPNGVHKFEFSTTGIATGAYFIRLRTYTGTGAVDKTQNSRFIIVH